MWLLPMLVRLVFEPPKRRADVCFHIRIANYYGPITTTPIEEMRAHWEINTLGPLILFQAVAPLLNKSENPHVSAISSGAGSLGDYFPIQAAA